MKTSFKKASPFLLIFLGILVLLILNLASIAGILILIGIVIIIERIWPEEWDSFDLNNNHHMIN